MFAYNLIADSSSSKIHPLESEPDQHYYDAQRHPPKKQIIFPEGVYSEVWAIAAIDANISDLVARLDPGTLIYDSG